MRRVLVFRASRLLAPINASSHQESSTVRSQQHASKLPVKLRKPHEYDFSPYRKPLLHKDEHHSTSFQHVSSPAEPPQEQIITNRSSK